MRFRDRYGPWALIAGASEGTGRAYAEQLAAEGLSLILIARRQAPLDTLARELEGRFDVEIVTASIDLGTTDAHEQVIAAAGEREVGLYISNAGADPNGSRFLDKEVDAWRSLVTRNVMTTMLCVHSFAGKMRLRGRGGVLLVNSYACYGGAQFLACYAGSKAFDLTFGEALWSELKDDGVDVLSFVMGMTDTPAFHALLQEKGAPLPAGTASAHEVAAAALANLGNGPIQNWGLGEDQAGPSPASAADRRNRVLMIDRMQAGLFGKGGSA